MPRGTASGAGEAAQGVARDSDDDDVGDIELDDAWTYDGEDVHRAIAVLRAMTKAGLSDSKIMRLIKDQCSQWQPGDSHVVFVMARFMKEASQSEAARAQFRARLLA